ncbi:MAG: YceI family protein [Alphaproteobacteria bacterium]|mgnify:CR=1 FL=1|nr:YceI family protein [Alphaproteobacteria bacterium]
MQVLTLIVPLALLASCVTGKQSLESVGEGAYRLEKPHASITWRVKHMGLSNYTARFSAFDIALDFDPANPGGSSVKAIIDPMSVRADHPTDEDWNTRLGADYFRAAQFPQIVFTSRSIETTGEFTGKVTGDLAFLGVVRPVTLDVTFNGAVPPSPLYGGRAAIGFSARGVLKRSDFGLTRHASFVGDEVEIIIEAEFSKGA